MGDFFVGEVSHFSWWNCDVPFSAVKLSGTVTNSRVGIGGLAVSIILADEMANLGIEFTGEQGLFCGWIPKDRNLIIQIRNECGQVVYEEMIGSFSEDTELPAITVSTQSTNIIELCGSVINCDSDPVADGYVVIQHEGGKNFIPVSETGDFCSTVNICDSGTFDIYGIDLTTGLQGTASTFNFDDSPFNDAELTACDQFVSYFSFHINNGPETIIEDFGVSINSADVLVAGSNLEVNGIFNTIILGGKNWGSDDFQFDYFDVQIASPTQEVDCDAFICDNFNVNVIEYDGVGKPIILQMNGISEGSQVYEINISGILE